MNVICSINTIVFFVEINADTLSLVVCLYIINTVKWSIFLYLDLLIKLHMVADDVLPSVLIVRVDVHQTNGPMHIGHNC